MTSGETFVVWLVLAALYIAYRIGCELTRGGAYLQGRIETTSQFMEALSEMGHGAAADEAYNRVMIKAENARRENT